MSSSTSHRLLLANKEKKGEKKVGDYSLLLSPAMPIALAKLVRNRSLSLFFSEFIVLFAYRGGYHVFY
jgi:hypothetical protein